jgi:hypothetical protein
MGGAIMNSLMRIRPDDIPLEEDKSGSNLTLLFDSQTVRYSATTNSQIKMSSPVYMVTCAQKNLARVWHLLSMLNRDYHNNGFNKFVSTKATPKQIWDKLEEHITFYSSKNIFFVAGEGLSNMNKSKVLSKSMTHQGKTSNLQDLLTAKKIFATIQHSQQGGCKIICQHNDLTISPLKPKAAATNPRTWFTTNIIGEDTTECLDWTTKKFEPKWSFERG